MNRPGRIGPWLRRWREVPDPRMRMVCLPPAGGGAMLYRDWSTGLPPDVELWAVQYPGREDRLGEPCLPTMAELVDRIAAALVEHLDRPVVLFGHSMGASVAYELTRTLRAVRPDAVRLLCVSARPAPEWQRRIRGTVHLRDDAGLVDELQVLGGIDPRVLEHAELRELVLPTIRSDFRLIETYAPLPAPPLDVPVLALTGDADPRVPVDHVADWGLTTTRRFDLAVFDGGHFYLTPHRDRVLDTVRRVLTETDRTPTELKEITVTTSELPTDLTESGIAAAVAEVLGLPDGAVALDANLIELGVDSIRLMALASRWQRHGVEVPLGRLAMAPTVTGWAGLLREQVGVG